ncbi:serine-threonine kinase receptor-associated protein [Platysternon megacephalum]|uniref:Serine-threonine kinase receptor-associated protein n=1 Tax=Platysternon megacephalum TaxID=55544 RepID=A0A4D9E8V8_9SAUR|nr:serine-threonine kinase receptor-associated protein [Platysternon megacephalum]
MGQSRRGHNGSLRPTHPLKGHQLPSTAVCQITPPHPAADSISYNSPQPPTAWLSATDLRKHILTFSPSVNKQAHDHSCHTMEEEPTPCDLPPLHLLLASAQ